MPDVTVASPLPKRRRWLKMLVWLAACLVVLLMVAYLVVTSSAFLKGVILPRVGSAFNASVTVGEASIHPFSGVTLSDLKVQPTGQEPLVTASEVRVRYHLWDILRGNIRVDEVALVSPTIELIQNPDGSHNWDPILKALQAKPGAEKPTPSAKTPQPPQIDLGKITLSNADIREIRNYAGGQRDMVEVTNVNVALTGLKNGQTAKLELDADLRLAENPPDGATGSLAASLKANFDCSLSADLKPGSVKGDANFSVSQAGGTFGDFDAFVTTLNCDVTPTDIKQLALRFEKAGADLGELAVTGPFDAEKMEGKLDVELRGVDRRLLNLAGAKSGLDFGPTTIADSTEIELAKAGAAITVSGKFAASKFQVMRAGQTTPMLDLSANYGLTVDRAAQTASLRSLSLAGTQSGGAPLLEAQLSSPMELAWGGSASDVGDAAFTLAVTNLSLADWQPFLGGIAPTGKVGVNLLVSSHQGGSQIGFDMKTDVAGLSVQLGSHQISQAEIVLSAQGLAAQFRQVALSACKLTVALQNQTALTVSGSGNYDLSNGDADLEVKLHGALARLLQALPQPGMTCAAGDVEVNAHVVQKHAAQKATGELALDNFDGQIGNDSFQDYSGKFDLDVVHSPEQIQINKIAGGFSQNGNSGGDFSLSGTYTPTQKSANVDLKLAGLNENALRPFLQTLLAGKTLASVTVSGDIAAQYQPQGGSVVKGGVQVTNLVVNDPKQQFPATPLAAGLQVDLTLAKQTADVRQFQISLTPTSRADNQLQLSGQVDFSNTKAVQGNLKLAADSLDLTSYYDLFTGGTNAGEKTATPPIAAPAHVSQEPPAVRLPVQNFTLDADIGQFYLHEIAITNFLTTVKMDSSHVTVKPFALVLNGAPVNAMADVDLGMPGYKYNVTFDAKSVPVAPLVDTFKPERAGQMGGQLTANAQITGAGVTGEDLKQNLTGGVEANLTNLNLSVANVRSPILKGVINVVATVPELLSNPASGVTALLGDVTGRGGLIKELQQSPIEWIYVKTTAGGGQVNLQQATVQSSAFEADATGGIKLDAVLTNSIINIPVTVSLSQAIASQLNLASTTAATNAAYVPLPQFFAMTGTLGKPKEDVNKLALAGTAVKALGGGVLAPVVTNAVPAVKNLVNGFLNFGK